MRTFKYPRAAAGQNGGLQMISFLRLRVIERNGWRWGNRDAGSRPQVAIPRPTVSNRHGSGQFAIGYQSLIGVIPPGLLVRIPPKANRTE